MGSTLTSGAKAPFRLGTLGPVELRGPDPATCARVVSQPKRLALLAYLAARPPGGPVSRDRIVATFWPELPAGRAQGNLRHALYWLRRELGSELLVSQGPAVGVSTSHLYCDAAILLGESEEAPETLLGLYRGEFLDALHLSGTPDFERWVDRTRATLRARASELAWTLAGRAEAAGEWITAARHARRAAALAVDVEGATQRLIRLLDRAGDRAAAVAEYERLAAELKREFGIVPSPETTALIDRVRDRTARDPVPPAPVAEGRPRSLAVLPFEDLSEGAGAFLANGLGEDLLTALARIRGVRVVSRTSVRRFTIQPPPSMRAVRDLLGVDLVLEGSVQLHGERCRITVQLIDARDDEHLWAETYDRALSDVFAVQSDVALRITRSLATELSPREHRRLRRPLTTSVRVWQLYRKGREAWSRRTADAARRAATLFNRALELDERFAPAWVGLADAHIVLATVGGGSLHPAHGAAQRAIERALELDPESGEARATVGLIKTFFQPDPPGAGRAYREAVELSPGYATAHQWYGNWLCAHGEPEAGLAELALATDLDPLSPVVSDSVGLALLHLGRLGEAEAQFRQTLELDPDFWRARLGSAVCRGMGGDLATAAAELIGVWRAGGFGTNPADAGEAERLLQHDAPAALEQLLRSARARGGDSTIRVIEIVLLMLLARHDEALAALLAGRRQGWLGTVLLYAPILDPLAARPQFRRLMEGRRQLMLRWRQAG